jgi:hypothetical protein
MFPYSGTYNIFCDNDHHIFVWSSDGCEEYPPEGTRCKCGRFSIGEKPNTVCTPTKNGRAASDEESNPAVFCG